MIIDIIANVIGNMREKETSIAMALTGSGSCNGYGLDSCPASISHCFFVFFSLFHTTILYYYIT